MPVLHKRLGSYLNLPGRCGSCQVLVPAATGDLPATLFRKAEASSDGGDRGADTDDLGLRTRGSAEAADSLLSKRSRTSWPAAAAAAAAGVARPATGSGGGSGGTGGSSKGAIIRTRGDARTDTGVGAAVSSDTAAAAVSSASSSIALAPVPAPAPPPPLPPTPACCPKYRRTSALSHPHCSQNPSHNPGPGLR